MPTRHPEDLPHPLVERGDWVRLKSAYRPSFDRLAEGLQTQAKLFALHQSAQLQHQYDVEDLPPDPVVDPAIAGGDGPQFTHGIVVEIISRYPKTRFDAGELPEAYRGVDAPAPAKNVSLHLFDPRAGLLWVGGHPTEAGKPEFVDTHIGSLTLLHKHDDIWGDSQPIDIADVYESWGASVLRPADDSS